MIDLKQLRQWIGKTERRSDTITAAPVAALSATLDRDDPVPRSGDPLPALWHWLYFLPLHKQSEIGSDGHPQRGGFLPPVPLPRRMWAGSRLQFNHPLLIGSRIECVSTIADISHKSGRSGDLVFVTVQHEFSNAKGIAGIAIQEEHDIVYRAPAKPDASLGKPQPAPDDYTWSREIRPDPVLLFRYSALTFNGHRIHYDRPYAMEDEGYPGLIVHGPLVATLLLDGLRRNRPGLDIARFAFRALWPLFDTDSFAVCGRPELDSTGFRLWTRNAEGGLTMDASVQIR